MKIESMKLWGKAVMLLGIVIVIIVAALASVGCTPAGLNFYRTVAVPGADGGPGTVKAVKVASFAAEFVGLKSFSMNAETGACDIQFAENLLVSEQYAVLNKKGELLGVLTRNTASGIYTAKVIEAYGEAGKKIVDSIFSGITGAMISAATPVALGNGLSAIPIK